ncbi:hypothetical protein HUW51_10815 [Adhaeribacter swui]|uniref:Type II secretion system protein GspG C-terminal domain-containing protein n=1 Tax=Adhaeribacter swui TaxID=2086471 RepID=A0A7G7G7R0_9BACT|nr:hypothetical protein [Adhaeribacter swui]QNF33194.1 hypothetical protein HUW51_10815 [Adhaeribacter swui]
MSRNIAIANAAALVKQIEQYHQKTGAYPKTVAELTKKIPPSGIIGVFTYFYDKTPNAYTVTFTQNVLFNFNFEVVQYDPTDSHQTTGESTNLNSTGKKHWKYYIYD